MRVKIYNFIIQCIIFCERYKSVYLSPFLGNKIINAKHNEFPFVVSMVYIENRGTANETISHVCTGTLVSRMDVVTSAHCTLNGYRNYMMIMVGSNNYRRGQRHSILWWITYDQWAHLKNITIEFIVNDIGNIRLIEQVSESIRIPELSNLPNSRFYGKEVVSVGWGTLNSNINQIGLKMKKVKLKVLTNTNCVNEVFQIIRQRVILDSKQGLCTKAQPYTLLSSGVSGGPLLYQNKVIAINKGTIPDDLNDGDPNLLNLHVAVEYYKGFISDIIDSNLV